MGTLEPCEGCGAQFNPVDGPRHEYMLASPACWATYGEVLEREYSNAVLFSQVHRLTVDAYAVQHPGDREDRRARQSFWIHLASLHMALIQGRSHAEAGDALKQLAGRAFPAPPRRYFAYAMTVKDVAEASEDDHIAAVRAWAEASYDPWSSTQATALEKIIASS